MKEQMVSLHGVIELGVTVFEFEIPSGLEQFTETVNEWLTSTKEGNRYIIKEPKEGSVLKIQRGKGIITAPIVLEFRIGATLGLPTEMKVRGYVHPFGLENFEQDLRPDANITAIPRRNGWKDMLKLLNHVNVSNYKHTFYS